MPISENILEQIRRNDPDFDTLLLPSQYPSLTANDMEILRKAMNGNTHLKKVILNDNDIGDEGAEILKSLKEITVLSLDANGLTDKGAQHLACMNLEELNVCANNIHNEGFRQLLKMPNLTALTANGNPITNHIIPDILNNRMLIQLSIQDTDIDRSQLGAIEKHIGGNRDRRMTASSVHTLAIPQEALEKLVTHEAHQLVYLINLAPDPYKQTYKNLAQQILTPVLANDAVYTSTHTPPSIIKS